MIVTIEGTSGSGKTTIARELCRCRFMMLEQGAYRKELAEANGVSLEGLKVLRAMHRVKNLVEVINEVVRSCENRLEYVVDEVIGFHALPDSLKIYLVCNPDEIERRTGRSCNFKYGKLGLGYYDSTIVDNYRQLYGVDISCINNYDLVIDTTYAEPGQIVNLIRDYISARERRDWSDTDTTVMVSPKSILPTVEYEDIQCCWLDESFDGNGAINVVHTSENTCVALGLVANAKVLAYLARDQPFVHVNIHRDNGKACADLVSCKVYEKIGNFRYKALC